MVDVAAVIGDAFALYKERWRDIVMPFLALALIAIVFRLINAALSFSQVVCDHTDNVYVLLALCYAPQIM